jgi:aminoglycoside phosphotransferase family enzyme
MTASIERELSEQEKVFAYLAGLATDPPVHRIDTHAASVFLVGSRALKIKRAVRFPFLDYSTLAKRKAACEAEMQVNHPFAPQIYHRVAPVTRSENGTLSLDGNGTPVEYAIEMARFDESQTIDHLAESGVPDPDLVAGIADAIAASHAVAATAPTEPWIELDRIEQDRLMPDHDDIPQMQVAMAMAHEPSFAALMQQLANCRECGSARLVEFIDSFRGN